MKINSQNYLEKFSEKLLALGITFVVLATAAVVVPAQTLADCWAPQISANENAEVYLLAPGLRARVQNLGNGAVDVGLQLTTVDSRSSRKVLSANQNAAIVGYVETSSKSGQIERQAIGAIFQVSGMTAVVSYTENQTLIISSKHGRQCLNFAPKYEEVVNILRVNNTPTAVFEVVGQSEALFARKLGI